MTSIKRYSLEAPIDPEVNVKVRDSLEYYMVFPSGYNENKKYGLVFCISGYGTTADSEYYLNKLCPYISDKYNIISVGVRYHNDERVRETTKINLPAICSFYNVDQSYFGSDYETILDRLFDLLAEKGLAGLDTRFPLLSEAQHKYSSFGFMPAIDHLFVLSDILKKYNIDRQNIIAFGTSYGGYVASLMAKYAPQTFSLVIDNSGFCVAQLQEVLGGSFGGVTGAIVKYIDGKRYEIPIKSDTLWSIDETSALYFSDAHKHIRSLLIEEHRFKSNTMYCCYHSVIDGLALITLKDKMYEYLSKYNPVYYKRVGEKDIDGELFKTTEHGMRASLRKMFDFSIQKYKEYSCKQDECTDFDLGSTYRFGCLDKQYNFLFSERGLEVTIDKLKTDSIQIIADFQKSTKSEVNLNDNSQNDDIHTNNSKEKTEIAKNIIDLIPTMKEALEYIDQNAAAGNLTAGMPVAEDFRTCMNSIKGAVKSINNTLPPNKLDYKIEKIMETMGILLKGFEMIQVNMVVSIIDNKLIPQCVDLEEEIIRVL